MPAPLRLFCFGLGYSAQALARRLAARGWRIAGTLREPEIAALPPDWQLHRFDGAAPLADFATALAGTTHLLSSAPPDGEGDPVLRHHADDLARLAGPAWAGYLSTTGVYGDRGGGWVDEETAPEPSGARGRRRLAAEAGWLALQREGNLPLHIFRLAGIYGPGRSAFEAIRAGTAKRIDKPGQVFGRIHVADIATTLEASIAKPRPGRIYNLCDDYPGPPEAVVAHACALLGIAPPPLIPFAEIEAKLSPMARSFYADSKRVSNARIKDELGVALAYPSYREGLKAILEQES